MITTESPFPRPTLERSRNVMRVGFVCCEYPPGPHGGIGTFTQVLSRALVEAGHQVRVIGLYRPAYPAPDYEEDHGVQVWRLRQPRGRFGWMAGRYRLFRQIEQWTRQGEVDLIEVPDWAGWAAGWPRLRVPVVARLNGSTSYFAHELNRNVRRTTFWLERASLRRANFWCSVSRYTGEKTRSLFRLASGPHAILHNPVETTFGAAAGQRSPAHVVFTGTLTPKKGVVSLIRAWPSVLKQCRSAQLHLYGKDGRAENQQSMQGFLLSLLDEDARGTVHFHGHAERAAVFRALQQARLAVFPSYAEAFALAPLEAMASGCPTIFTKRGSGDELIDDGADGLLVDPDQPDEIAAAILRLLSDDALAASLGAAGQQRVKQHFSIAALLPRNERFYQACIQGRICQEAKLDCSLA